MTNHDRAGEEPRFTALTIVEGSDHIPEVPLEPLIASGLGSAESETRGLRRDGWTPERKRLFQETLAECGTVAKACRVVGMSAQSAYALRNRDPLFAAGWDTALLLARQHLADEIMARCMNGVIEQVYRNGEVVAERYHYDNRLSIAMLNRLDARADRAERLGAGQHALAARWSDYLDAIGQDRRADGLALLKTAPEGEAAQNAPQPQFHQLPLEAAEGGCGDPDEDEEEDGDHVWMEDDGVWWTDYPPPPDFAGEEIGDYDDGDYCRTLAPAEAAVMAARAAVEQAQEEAELAEDRREAERARDLYFGFRAEEDAGEDEAEEDEADAGDEKTEDADSAPGAPRHPGFDTAAPAPIVPEDCSPPSERDTATPTALTRTVEPTALTLSPSKGFARRPVRALALRQAQGERQGEAPRHPGFDTAAPASIVAEDCSPPSERGIATHRAHPSC